MIEITNRNNKQNSFKQRRYSMGNSESKRQQQYMLSNRSNTTENQKAQEFVHEIEQKNKQNMEQRKSINAEKKQKPVRRSVQDRQMLKEELNLMKTDFRDQKESTQKQNSSRKEIERSQREERSQVVIEEVDENGQEIQTRSGVEKRSKRFRPNR